MKVNLKMMFFIVVIAVLVMGIYVQGVSLPEGPTSLTENQTSGRQPAAVQTATAVAGNVTQLIISAQTVTQSWAGFYGTITGLITLDDASNNTLYNWSLARPEGEIYAATGSVDFTTGNIHCYNLTKSDTGDSGYITLSELEALYNITSDDVDGINETFTMSNVWDSFFVGGYNVSDDWNDYCAFTALYGDGGNKTNSEFQQVLLYDNASDIVVYTSILEENDVGGFTGSTDYYDFQMIVNEDGHFGDLGTTTYYFYVELE